MRIAIIHSFYRSDFPSGENDVVAAQASLLKAAGHQVKLISAYSDELRQSLPTLSLVGIKVAFGLGVNPIDEIRSFKPDLVHVHNLFPNFGYLWLNQIDIPIVATIHNFRSFCANGFFLREGEFCTKCPDTSAIFAVVHKCYQNSSLKSVPLSILTRRSGSENVLLNRANAIITLSDRANLILRKFISQDLINNVRTIPNFYLPPRKLEGSFERDNSWIFAGRLSPEKGVLELISNWPTDLNLLIFGEGIERDRIRQEIKGRANIKMMGAVSSDTVFEALSRSQRFVFPSIWNESAYPIVFLQALAANSYVVSARNNSVGDFLEKHQIGKTVDSVKEIGVICSELDSDTNIRNFEFDEVFRNNFSSDLWLERMQEIYQNL